jgi:hypothetical protein
MLGQAMEAQVTGTADGGHIKGSISLPEMPALDFTGTRQ